ncbi:hypothetical protein [Bacterioplanoides pacificum]|uniref:Uncharacterized protein n=1 Tax=Bacterioplanoides pacificum TaxID=1171596 RepID=A0ABV7VVT2_9GAMM
MNAAPAPEQRVNKPQSLQASPKVQLNTGFYDVLTQIALTHKRSRTTKQA